MHTVQANQHGIPGASHSIIPSLPRLIGAQTLSDPDLRKKYNEFGSRESQPEGGFMDPEEFFSQLFGGEKFVPIIGHISLGRDMKTALQEDRDETATADGPKRVKSGKDMTPEEKAKKDEKSRKEAAAVRSTRTLRV